MADPQRSAKAGGMFDEIPPWLLIGRDAQLAALHPGDARPAIPAQTPNRRLQQTLRWSSMCVQIDGASGDPASAILIYNIRPAWLATRRGRKTATCPSFILEVENSKDILGFNITSPFKVEMMEHVFNVDARAESIGAINTVKIERQREGRKSTLIGYNTDFDGVVATLGQLRILDARRGNKQATIFGAGGAARACILALVENGFTRMSIFNRNLEHAEPVAEHFRILSPKTKFDLYFLSDHEALTQSLMKSEILINAISSTVLGNPFQKLNLSKVPRRLRVFDLGYKEESELLNGAKKNGLLCVNGIPMLVEQAAKSFEIWTGKRAPRKTMLAASTQF